MSIKFEPALEGLRGVAIVGVMVFHFAREYMTGGSFGVDIFFVLSGYLITSILLREIEADGHIEYLAFLVRRARRLLPALGVMLIVYAIFCRTFSPFFADRQWLDIATAAFYVTNLRQVFWPIEGPLSHTWSLGIEEQFYILWPLLLPALVRSKRHAIWILGSAWLVLSAARPALAMLYPGNPAIYYFTPLHATGLILGAIVAIRPFETSLGRVALALLAALLIGGTTTFTFIFTIPLAELATALVIAAPPGILKFRPLRWLGKISYGVYLWHIPVLWAIDDANPALLFLASIGLGAASYYLVERWFLRQPAKLPREQVAIAPDAPAMQ